MLDITNVPDLLENLKADKTAADPYKTTWDSRREVWINESNGAKYGNEQAGKSSIVSRDIKKTEIWQHATIIDPFVSNTDMVRCSPVSAGDKPIADQTETLLNHFFCREFDRYNLISEAYRIEQREGTVVARVGWEFQEEEVEVQVPITKMVAVPTPQGVVPQPQIVGYETQTEMRTVVNRPTADNRDNKTLWIDPTEKQNISKAQFVIEHFKSSISRLTQEGLYENLDEIDVKTDEYTDSEEQTYDDSDNMSFKFKDRARAELDVYEYWGNYDLNDDGIAEAIVCTWVGNTIIRLDENPYPDQEVPYISVAMNPEPFSINGRPNADMQSTDQKMNTSIIRSIMDTLDSSTQGQRGYQEGTLDPANERKFKSHQDFKFQGEKPNFWEGKHADINPSIVQFYEMIRRDQSELTGVRPFAGGEGNFGSATAARQAMGAVAKLEVDISRNLSENFVIPLLRKWTSMMNAFMEPQEVERITGKPYVPPAPDNMNGSIDIRIEVNTAESDKAKADRLAFQLQTMGQSLPFELTKMLLVEQAELEKMPGLAKRIMEYQPQPDPMEQQMKQLQMQEIQASIMEKQSRARENEVDMKLKESQTILNQAKARQAHGLADSDEQAFVDQATGKTHQQELEKQDQKIRGDLAKHAISNTQKQGVV